MSERDVLVIGGGPAGSTAAAVLADQGRAVTLVEKARFPRFHIGESLLPATVKIFDRLGLHEKIKTSFLHKPGGKWRYGKGTVWGDFACSDSRASFQETPYSYMVERSRFDQMLLERAEELGAEVLQETEVREVLEEDRRVVGLRVRGADGEERELRTRWVVDASGARSVVANHFGLRKKTTPQRMAVYTHYRARPVDEQLCEGWFVGEQIYDGWVWTIPLAHDLVSVGLVLSVDAFKRTGLPPEELLERWMRHSDLLQRGITSPEERVGEVHVTGSMGHSSTRLVGEGWCLVGDAAYFIDPCWSSGVHLAMHSGENVADLLHGILSDRVPVAADFTGYEHEMRLHERQVRKMVDAFYMASRNPLVQGFITKAQLDLIRRKAVTFIGGDFSKNSGFVWRWHKISWLLETLTGWAYPPPPPPPPTAEASSA